MLSLFPPIIKHAEHVICHAGPGRGGRARERQPRIPYAAPWGGCLGYQVPSPNSVSAFPGGLDACGIPGPCGNTYYYPEGRIRILKCCPRSLTTAFALRLTAMS
jgi:hypothetical protein